jgi:hypothetical protein
MRQSGDLLPQPFGGSSFWRPNEKFYAIADQAIDKFAIS